MKNGAFDVVVVGSGVGGLSAAVAAAQAGLSVAVFEKDKLLGGGTGWAHGGIWVGCNHIGLAAGHKDSKEAVLQYLRFVGGEATEEPNLKAFADHAPAAIRFFERCGVKFQITRGLPDHYYPSGPGSTAIGRSIEPMPVSIADLGKWRNKLRESDLDPPRLTVEEFIAMGGTNNRQNWDHALIAEREKKGIRTRGPALIAYFLKALLRHETPIHLSTAVTGLVQDKGRVSGVRTRSGLVKAKRGVVLATGGWEADAELTKSYEALPGWSSMFPRAVNGDGLRLASDAGAAVTLIRNNLALFLGFPVPMRGKESEFRLSSIYELLCPHTIVVNSRGERFADESYFQSMAAALRRFDIWAREFPNLPCYLVFDSQYVRNFSFCGRELGAAPPGWVTRAESLADLARKLKLSPEGLEKTAQRFNGFASEGADPDFHRGEKHWTLAKREEMKSGNAKNRTLGTLEVPPYYGIKLSPSAFASGGVRVSPHAEVLNTHGESIRGLYAVGNAAAHTEYGIGYQAGYSLASGLTFGLRCIKHMK